MPAAPKARLVHVRRYAPANWLTKAGVNRKRAAIERKGLPSFKNWRFITLTLDRELFDGPLDGYLRGKDRLRRFMKACRDAGLWTSCAKWAWKMEFHADGWCHWHLLVERTAKFSHEQLRQLDDLWGLGYTQTERVRLDDFLYSFKYCFKAAFQAEADDDGRPVHQVAPSWFMDHLGASKVTVAWTDAEGIDRSEVATKPVSFSRVRFWQTSRGFYTTPPAPAPPAKEQQTWSVPLPVRVAFDRLHHSVQVVARTAAGRYRSSAVLPLSCSTAHFWDVVGWHTVHGAAVGLAVNSYAIPAHVLTSNLLHQWQANPQLMQNRFLERAARRLQRQGESLHRM